MQIPRHPASQVLQHHRIIDIETAGLTVNTQFLFLPFYMSFDPTVFVYRYKTGSKRKES